MNLAKILLSCLFVITCANAFAGDVEKASTMKWKPMVYPFLTKPAQRLLDQLPIVDSRNNIVLHYILKNLEFKNCKFESHFKNEYVQVSVLDKTTGAVYHLNFPKFESKAGPVSGLSDKEYEYYMAVTDTEEVDGITYEGATYTAEIKVSRANGAVTEVHVLSDLKTVFNGSFLEAFGGLFGRKPIEAGLDLVCKN